MKIGFYSTMTGVPWGGSEVLWSRVAHRLLAKGTDVTVNYRWWEEEPSELQKLRAAGATVWPRRDPTWRSWPYRWKPPFDLEDETKHLQRWIAREQPDGVMVTLGYHLNPVLPADELIRRGIPYAINVQSVSTETLDDQYLDEFRTAYTHARKVYFVSQENLDRVETNLAVKLDNAVVIDNPFNVSWDANPDWPANPDCPANNVQWRLACVARIHFTSKGQDVLVHLLKQDKWRDRNLSVHLFGVSQGNLRQTQDLIERYHLQETLLIAGYAENVEAVWANHHGLVLPSRFEGAALAVVEALLCNRICITTDVGRNRELIDDGETGFIAPAATVELFDQALEAAWQKREQWHEMGKLAGERIRQRYGEDPVAAFQNAIIELARTNG
ncbi:glycosyltransferase family 4 protein [Aporhodopirellula aestuarii]|uniref:Glycosyltransferase family 4 protein n=1 Tax=Aporhodopirellula aestuarii TaxID=2950107 RepID=A0ABT0U093_9BACT|nr:glycosyltransferase family 4 protein [Aporhodopirellula aestuarii]MCM2370260.1 glycosyltransferase family 4 protein [Aporhodopirellula aestuarii]